MPGSAAASSRATDGVSSEEPLSTTTQRTGRTVCAARHSASRGRLPASLRAGVMTAYESMPTSFLPRSGRGGDCRTVRSRARPLEHRLHQAVEQARGGAQDRLALAARAGQAVEVLRGADEAQPADPLEV